MTAATRTSLSDATGARTAALRAAVARVVASGNCSGCGACTLLDPGLRMRLDEEGNLRPVPVDPQQADSQSVDSQPVGSVEAAVAAPVGPDAVRRFEEACPGVTVRAVRPPSARRHPTMGPYLRVWMAWATDTDVRFREAAAARSRRSPRGCWRPARPPGWSEPVPTRRSRAGP